MNPIKTDTMETRELTRAELEIMQILWLKEAAFVNEIIDEMPEPKPAYNTVSTVVRVLEKKGVVDHRAFGKSHQYFPLIGKEQYTKAFMRGVMNNFFDNSLAQLVSFFCEKENLSVGETERIAAVAREAVARRKRQETDK